jgi:hypothetical protein
LTQAGLYQTHWQHIIRLGIILHDFAQIRQRDCKTLLEQSPAYCLRGPVRVTHLELLDPSAQY